MKFSNPFIFGTWRGKLLITPEQNSLEWWISILLLDPLFFANLKTDLFFR